LFTLVFNATQAQHIQDVSTYLTGADFSGSIPVNTENSTKKAATSSQELEQYQNIPGVLNTSIGFSTHANGGNTNLPLEVRAIDTATFANAVIWSSQTEYRSANALLVRLQEARFQVITTKIVPVIVDTNVIDSLQLHVGSSLVVKEDAQTVHDIHCVIVGVVQHIPTVNDRVATDSTSGNRLLVTGGVLLDYVSYATVYALQAKGSSTGQTASKPNLVWIHSKDDAASLTSVRSALNYPSALALDKLSDRRALLSSLNNDPLYVNIGGVLALGTITALLLAFLGDLLASWLSARTRLTTFAVLRALGTTPQQVTGLLTWEQAIVYITGLVLGIVFGITFALTAIPSLTFTDLSKTTSSSAFYNLQTSLPTQVVLPSTLPLALLILVLIFVAALVVMVRVLSRPLLAQSLRLNED
ncbi:MAG: FtsX-like permease family protein, partial [Ktedonobacteraceae bacterium]|nr:FtsX-like permease family protein [Ktedonobacteraceae bacterium]